MKIAGVTLCYNESKMVKYVMPYWERMGIDKLIVYDNLSTDNTVELLKKYPFVEVRSFDTGGKFDDKRNSQIKADAAKELRDAGYDWVCCTDFDEVIYCFNPNFKEELQKIENLGGTMLCRDMIMPYRPDAYEFDPNKLVHEQMTNFLTWYEHTYHLGGCKVLMFNTHHVPEIKYAMGAHTSSFPGKNTNPVMFGYPFITLHLKYVDFVTLEENSHGKNERILWRIDADVHSAAGQSIIRNLYGRTMGSENINKTITLFNKRIAKFTKDPGWESMLKRYNEPQYILARDRYTKYKKVKLLDYENVDMSLFYKP